jgi:phage-related baseplate assembly protein
MYEKIEKELLSLQEPLVFSLKSFDELLNENIALAKDVLGEDWIPLESDPYMKKLRVLTLRQLHNQADKKETVKQLLLTTATGANLDNLGASENVFRDAGEYPYTNFEFKLLVESKSEIVIPAGLILSDETKEHHAKVVESVSIAPGMLSCIVKVELQEFVEESEVKTEKIVTDLPFALEIKQLDAFKHGASAESDDRYRLRIIASKDRYATAGSKEAYIYHAVSADSRIDDIVVLDEKVLEVNIYIASFSGVDSSMIKRVEEACNKRYVRPLGDRVIVKAAEILELKLSATIEVFDLLKQYEIEKSIRENFSNSFFIGQDFVRSDFIRKCHIDGVYRVDTDFKDVIVSDKQIIKIASLTLVFKEASL